MANRKEYEMLFALNAQMNGNFAGTFSKAQAEFSRLGKEIQELQKVQGNISSYQKQQTAIDATRTKLSNLQQQHDLLQKEINETTGSTAALEREKLKLEQRIKDTEAALSRQEQRLEATDARLKEAGVDTAALSQKNAELTAKIGELRAEQDKAAESSQNFGEKSSQAFEAIQGAIIATGIVKVLGEIKDAYVECVGVAGDFEETMSTVEALSQANAQEMAALTAEAKELGATTKFTAKESGQAMSYMAMAGWDATDMLQGMDGVLQLAAASGENLAMVSNIVTDSLSAFGLTAKDTAHFSDVLAAAATKSNTNVAIMGETFKMSASVAGALGYSIEDVAVAMGLMANSGTKGSIAGTALRNTFNGLLEGVTLTSAAFGEYEYSAVRADGTMKDFGSTIDELRGYFEQMTEAERVNNAMTIAGQRGYNGLLAILNATEEDYASLTASINDCTGAAQRMAAVKMDNLNGQLTLMDSAWDALKTTIGEEFNPELRKLAETGTDVLGEINDFVRENPVLVKSVMTFTGVMGGATVAVTGINAAMKAFKALNVATLFTGPVGAILGATAAVAGIAAGVVALTTATDESIPSVKELTEAARDMQRAMDEAGTTYEQTMTQTMATAEVVATYIDKLEEIEAATDGNVRENQEYRDILTLITRTVPELADNIDLTTNSIDGGTEALRQHTEAWQKDIEMQTYQEYINSLYDQYGEVLAEAAENSIKLTQAQIKLENANQKLSNTYERMDELYAEAQQAAQDYFDEYGEWADATAFLSQEYYDLQDSIDSLNNEIYGTETTIENLKKAINLGSDTVADAEAAIESGKAAIERLTGATNRQTEAEALAAAQTQELQMLINDTAGEVLALAEAYEEAYGAALKSVSGQYALWDEAAAVVATSSWSINSALESQISYWQDYNKNLESLTKRSGDIEGLNDLIASFADGSADSVNAIAGLADASDDELRKMVDNWQELQEEQKAVSDSIAQIAVDIPGQMQQIEDSMRESISEMEFSDEAAKSAHDAIQAFIDQADNMMPMVQDAYGKLGAAANNALAGRFSYNSQGINNYYASGTESAAPGLAMVGERGPELVYFRGGEKVLTAEQTASALQAQSSRDSSSPLSITFQIGGNATPEVVQDLRNFAGEIVEQVMDAIAEKEEDAQRRAY